VSNGKEWLDTLKVGDEVLVTGRYTCEIRKIEKITPTRQIKIGAWTFRNGWHSSSDRFGYGFRIEPVTQKMRDHIRKVELERKINKVIGDLSLNKLESIFNIIEATEQPSETGAE
jgi:hypothetical protein